MWINVNVYYKFINISNLPHYNSGKNKGKIGYHNGYDLGGRVGDPIYAACDGVVLKVDVTKNFITYYEYEIQENDNKRTIKILKPEFSGSVEQEFRRVING